MSKTIPRLKMNEDTITIRYFGGYKKLTKRNGKGFITSVENTSLKTIKPATVKELETYGN